MVSNVYYSPRLPRELVTSPNVRNPYTVLLMVDNRCHRLNFGRGRYIPFNNKIFVHKSVKKRLENQELNYVPAAHNWKIVEDMIEYVE